MDSSMYSGESEITTKGTAALSQASWPQDGSDLPRRKSDIIEWLLDDPLANSALL